MYRSCALLTTVLFLSFSVLSPVFAGLKEALVLHSAGRYEEAFKEIESLAKQGDVDAQYALGVLYRDGEGIKKDMSLAIDWFIKSADQGHASAQYNLGVLYRDGEGVKKDSTLAIDWFRKAAEQGYAPAQKALDLLNSRTKK